VQTVFKFPDNLFLTASVSGLLPLPPVEIFSCLLYFTPFQCLTLWDYVVKCLVLLTQTFTLTIQHWPGGLARGDSVAKWDKPSWRHPSHSRPPAKEYGELLCSRVDVATGVGAGRAVCHVSQLEVPL